MKTSLSLEQIANDIIKYEQILNTSHSKIELAHAEQKINSLCEDLNFLEMLQLDEIVREKISKKFA